MASEIAQIVQFLEGTSPFDTLPAEERAKLSRAISVTYFRSGETVLEAGSHNESLYLVRSGAVELRLAGEELTARIGTGASFAYPSLLRGGEVRNTTIALEDTLLYSIPAEHFHRLRESEPRFREYYARDENSRIRHALERQRKAQSLQLDRTLLENLISRGKPVSCAPGTTIRAAAKLMSERNVSTLAVCEDERLLGIFTDKDLRSRVVAAETALDQPISTVMTANPRTLSGDASVAEAMAMMASGGFRHIPLLGAGGNLAGILSATDILSFLGNNAIDAGMAVARSKTDDELIAAARQVPESFAAMVASGVQASHAMRFTSALGEAVHRRAAELAEEELGAPPVPYALVVFGSLARSEQLVGSDQDNGLVIHDSATEADFAYFERLGTRISDILDACGYAYCKGGIMAKNAEQRRTASGWQERYAKWIERPNEDRILRATIFFDMRHVHGDASLSQQVRQDHVDLFKDSPLFVSFLARDALRSKIPLGIFRNLVLDRAEDGQKVFDAKRQAIMPIVDIARTHALAAGLAEVGTIDRLRALASTGAMNSDDAQSLEDAMLLVNEMRIAHQARQVEAGKEPDNLIAPDDLSPLERDYLKDAFAVIRSALDSLRRNFAGGIA
ncbi:DUF294 nucleotidyltransferase-like domain-containing protein [Altererythrobacter lutimaris]|uniref:Cyclic nucleotide-binding/CBS domain-containing protein n=1 Tax=Altererythrobacter lutimaris TaxID=2743979 RepID=A0A850H9Q5_9SPHN|nr:DUF294 nucleotidyltransferase-like domain-containing protein [Altererythrobacter lutimaris]NVE95897.1 cyclic nucleotide-binding/CBS domain-containing protein [Altererythrobacter lutimaris]